MREVYHIQNVATRQFYILTWQPKTFMIYNYSRFPVYVNVGSVALPSPTGFTDVIPQFFFYSTDPVGSVEFAVFVNNIGNEAEKFALPINVVFSSAGGSYQAALSSQL